MQSLLTTFFLLWHSILGFQIGLPFPGPGTIHSTGGGTPGVCGFNGTKGGTDGGDNNTALGIFCTPAFNSTVTSCVVSINTAGGNAQCAVYLASAVTGTGSAPPICISASTVMTTGDNVMSMSGCGTLTSGTAYAILMNNNAAAIVYDRDSTQTGCSMVNTAIQASTYLTWPSSGAWNTVSVCNYRFWLNTLH